MGSKIFSVYDDILSNGEKFAIESKQDTIIASLASIASSTGLLSPVVDTPEYFEDTSFVTGDSPVTLDINAALGRNANVTTVINDGTGNFTVAYSTNGSAFGDEITMKKGESLTFKDISVDSIRITWVTNSSYRVMAI